MKYHLVRGVGLALALSLLPVLIAAQRERPEDEPPGVENGCRASGIRCLFGRAGGCTVVCPPSKNPVCEGAYCTFGFPHRSKCYCTGSGPST